MLPHFDLVLLRYGYADERVRVWINGQDFGAYDRWEFLADGILDLRTELDRVRLSAREFRFVDVRYGGEG